MSVAESTLTPSTKTNQKTTCPICEKPDYKPLYKGLVKCDGCGFVWADLQLSDEELKKLYADNYFFGGEYRDYLEEEIPIRKDFKRNLAGLLKFQKGGRLYEWGAAYGFFLDEAKKHFDSVSGCDVNKDATIYAKEKFGFDVKHGGFLDLDIPENSFDAVASWATLEHIQDPMKYFEKSAKILKPGGYFAFSTCDMETFVPRLRKSKWRVIHPPTHLSYFSHRNLKLGLEKAGLKEVSVSHIGQYRSVDSVLYAILVLINKRPKLYNFLKKIGLTKGSFYLNTGDVIHMVAQKPK